MEAAPATLSSWQTAAPSTLPVAKPASPPQRGHEAAAPAESSSSSQHSLFSGFASAGDPPSPAHTHADTAAATSAQLRNLQRLYGNLAQMHHHSSRSSLPDIAEEEPSPVQPMLDAQRQASAASVSAAPGPSSSRQGLHAAGQPGGKVMSEEDIFAMGGGLEIAGAPGGGSDPGGAQQGSGSGAGGLVAGVPPLAYDLSLVGQMPAGQSQSRTLFVRNIDATVSDEELHAVFEVRGQA
jgi:hypothetical protein